eukprot:8338962-Alexandrium_andersonii.AAC.1
MSASLVGSEMCIRDRIELHCPNQHARNVGESACRATWGAGALRPHCGACLLYTSDAADDM